jgi:quercetin dioxygenase-like cupin family protein
MTVIVPPDSGTVYDWMSDSMRFCLTASDTDGLCTLIEDRLKPGFQLALHLHRTHSETFYILEGQVTFVVEERTIIATPGTVIHIPPNTPHAVHSAQAARLLTLYSPGGLEGAMQAFAALTPDEAQDPAIAQAINEKYDIVNLA